MAPSQRGFICPLISRFSVAHLFHEAHGFSPARKGQGALAVWGLVLGSLLIGVATVAAVTATAWVHGGAVIS